MFTSGLLVLTSPAKLLTNRIQLYLKAATQHINKTLYINLKPVCNTINKSADLRTIPPFIYSQASKYCGLLDVRVLQGSLKHENNRDFQISENIDVVLTDSSNQNNEISLFLKAQFGIDSNKIPIIADFPLKSSSGLLTNYKKQVVQENATNVFQTFNFVVLGGTFDNLHNGHKVLLSEAIARCNKQLTIGVTDKDMIKSKILWELIRPIEKRFNSLRAFLQEVDPTLGYLIVPILDPFGPSIVDPELQCIVASQETSKGAQKVNEKRIENGLKELYVHIVSLVEDNERKESDEIKISSSSIRKRLLGNYFKGNPIQKCHLPPCPHLIGLTGGIASGKSAIAKDLAKLGAGLVDCDKLAHLTYEPGQTTYQEILEKFGKDILKSDSTIDRKKLGAKVFGNEDNRKWLNSLVWPAVAKLVEEKIQDLFLNGFNVIVLEVALLIEAGWQDRVHEVWTSIVSEKDSVQRIISRDSLSQDEALQRIRSQTTNAERIEKSDIIFCSSWERRETIQQVEMAWNLLTERLLEKKKQ